MRGFTIGRFQPFHAGHRRFVERIADEVDELVVAIGSADASHELANPFTAGERLLMLNKAFAEIDVPTYVVPLEDIERNALWVAHVRSMCPPFDVGYSNNPLVVRLLEEAGIEVRSSPLYDRETLQGTELRRRMRAGEPWEESVPDPVVEVIHEIDGVERIRQVSASDGDTEGENTPATDGGQAVETGEGRRGGTGGAVARDGAATEEAESDAGCRVVANPGGRPPERSEQPDGE